MLMLEEEQQGKRRRRNDRLGMATPAATDHDQFAKLPDELALEILSRSWTTLNEAARCSSLLGKRWRYMWQSIHGGVLDFDQGGEKITNHVAPEERRRFADRVDQAMQSRTTTTLDGLRIGFNLLEMEEEVWRWIRFGFAARVKQLTLSSYFHNKCCRHPTREFAHSRSGVSVSPFTPDFLCKQDLSRLEVLELRGLYCIPQGTLDHIFSNCLSLQSFSLNRCIFPVDTVIRVCCPRSNNNLRRLTFYFTFRLHNLSRIELVSAPGLHRLEVGGGQSLPQIEFGDDIPQLRELSFSSRGQSIYEKRLFFPWSRSQFDKFAPRLQILNYELSSDHFPPFGVGPPPEWLLFEKLTVLHLPIKMDSPPTSFSEYCTALLRAAPRLRQLSISFLRDWPVGFNKRRDQGAKELSSSSTWKHHSLQVLQLHGVHLFTKEVFDPHLVQLDLAADIIINSPSLNEVLIDTANVIFGDTREPHQVDADILEARMQLETCLCSHVASSQIHFTYR